MLRQKTDFGEEFKKERKKERNSKASKLCNFGLGLNTFITLWARPYKILQKQPVNITTNYMSALSFQRTRYSYELFCCLTNT
jgi:hypothetical protein